MQLVLRDKMKDYGDKQTGWDSSAKERTFGWWPVRSYTCWLRIPWERYFAPQWVLHHRLKMGEQKRDDPLHSSPLLDDFSDHRLWLWCPLSCQAGPMVWPCWGSFPSLEACSRHWRHNGTALPERDSWQQGSSCKAHPRPSCSASCGLPIVRSEEDRSPTSRVPLVAADLAWRRLYPLKKVGSSILLC